MKRDNTILFLYFVGMFTMSFLFAGCAKQPTPKPDSVELVNFNNEEPTPDTLRCCKYFNPYTKDSVLCYELAADCKYCFEICEKYRRLQQIKPTSTKQSGEKLNH